MASLNISHLTTLLQDLSSRILELEQEFEKIHSKTGFAVKACRHILKLYPQEDFLLKA